MEKNILLVDVDPQGNATSGMGIDKANLDYSIYDVLINGCNANDVIIKTDVSNYYILPANIDLAGAEIELVSTMSRESRLKKVMNKIKGYDYIIYDCPPSLGLLTLNALTAVNSIIVPIQCEYYALEGLGQLMRTIELVKDNLNPKLKLEGVLMTMYDSRTNLSQQVVEEVKNHFTNKVYNTIIPRNVRLSEAPSFGKPITTYDAKSKGASAYIELAKEVNNNG